MLPEDITINIGKDADVPAQDGENIAPHGNLLLHPEKQ